MIILNGTTDNMNHPDIMTIKQLATYLQMRYRAVYTLASQREIPSFRINKLWCFRKEDIDNWIDEQKRITKRKIEEKQL